MKKLHSIVDALNLLGLHAEAMMASNLALDPDGTEAANEPLLNIADMFSAENLFSKSDGSNTLDKWNKLISAIDGGTKSGYEVDMMGLASELMSSISSVKDKAGISPGTPSDRAKTVSSILSGNLSEDNAVDQTSSVNPISRTESGRIKLDEATLDEIVDNAISAISHNCSGEELKEINLIRGMQKAAALDYITGNIYAEGYIQKSGSAWKVLTGKVLPIVGLLVTLPLFIKNLIEAANNGYDIAFKLPLSKYGISKIMLTNPSELRETILSSVESNKDDPDSLLEILEISNVIERFWLDFIFAVTNGLMLIIDLVAALEAVGLIAGTAASAGTATPITATMLLASTAVQVGVTMGLVGVELATEAMSKTYWKRIYSEIRIIALLNIKQHEDNERTKIAS